ncbi:hypothetical protein [Methanobrevibacter sp.]|uniref:hypothetical protein n=1 Tax=Methanobrevibacter sp. TaxID=66852 RepID=UPI0038641C69
MNISKKLIAVLAIFCLIASAGVVCAEDVSGEGDVGSDGGYSGSGDFGSGDDIGPDGPTDVAPDGVPYHDDGTDPTGNATGDNSNTTGNVTNKTGNVTNTTGNHTNHTNATNATANHGLLSTGNPILILLVVIAIVGAVIVIKRK